MSTVDGAAALLISHAPAQPRGSPLVFSHYAASPLPTDSAIMGRVIGETSTDREQFPQRDRDRTIDFRQGDDKARFHMAGAAPTAADSIPPRRETKRRKHEHHHRRDKHRRNTELIAVEDFPSPLNTAALSPPCFTARPVRWSEAAPTVTQVPPAAAASGVPLSQRSTPQSAIASMTPSAKSSYPSPFPALIPRPVVEGPRMPAPSPLLHLAASSLVTRYNVAKVFAAPQAELPPAQPRTLAQIETAAVRSYIAPLSTASGASHNRTQTHTRFLLPEQLQHQPPPPEIPSTGWRPFSALQDLLLPSPIPSPPPPPHLPPGLVDHKTSSLSGTSGGGSVVPGGGSSQQQFSHSSRPSVSLEYPSPGPAADSHRAVVVSHTSVHASKAGPEKVPRSLAAAAAPVGGGQQINRDPNPSPLLSKPPTFLGFVSTHSPLRPPAYSQANLPTLQQPRVVPSWYPDPQRTFSAADVPSVSTLEATPSTHPPATPFPMHRPVVAAETFAGLLRGVSPQAVESRNSTSQAFTLEKPATPRSPPGLCSSLPESQLLRDSVNSEVSPRDLPPAAIMPVSRPLASTVPQISQEAIGGALHRMVWPPSSATAQVFHLGPESRSSATRQPSKDREPVRCLGAASNLETGAPNLPALGAAMVPSFSDFVMGVILGQGLPVMVDGFGRETGTPSIRVFDECLQDLAQQREAQFQQMASLGALKQLRSLCSRATIEQASSVQPCDWFRDSNENSMKLQSQLLGHVYSAAQPRDILGNYFSLTLDGLDPHMDQPKFNETRRIQNAMRRMLEFTVETALVDVVSRHLPLFMGETEFVVEPSPAIVTATQRAAWAAIMSPTKLQALLPLVYARLQAMNGSNADPAITVDEFDALMAAAGWWPEELNGHDRKEIAETLALSSSEAEYDFVRGHEFPTIVTEGSFVRALSLLPMNTPDFCISSRNELPRTLSETLKEVVEVADQLAEILTSFTPSEAEKAIATTKLKHGNHRSNQGLYKFQFSSCLRSPYFAAQDFLVSNLISIEELQILLALNTGEKEGDSASEWGTEMDIIAYVQAFHKGEQQGDVDKDRPLVPLGTLELALQFMIGLAFFKLSSSERFSVRWPMSSLAVNIQPRVIAERYRKQPIPLPPRRDCYPLALTPFRAIDSTVKLRIRYKSLAEVEREMQQRRKELAECLPTAIEDLVTGDQAESASRNISCNCEATQHVDIDEECLLPLVILHSQETLNHAHALLVPPPNNKHKPPEPHIPLDGPDIRLGDPLIWQRFWGQVAAGSGGSPFGPFRWGSLTQMANVYKHIRLVLQNSEPETT